MFSVFHAIRLPLSDFREESWMTNVPLCAVAALPLETQEINPERTGNQ
jgi:hypothetical protein